MTTISKQQMPAPPAGLDEPVIPKEPATVSQ